MYTDPIADMLNRIRTAKAVSKEAVDIPFSLIKYNIALCLEKEGFVGKIVKKKKEKRKFFRVFLNYKGDSTSSINEIKRISSPGQRVYARAKELQNIKGGCGVSIISTPLGVMSNKEARRKNLGGEIICEVW